MSDFTLYGILDELAVLIDSLDMTAAGSPERAQCEAEIQVYLRALPQKVDGIAHVLKTWENQVSFGKAEVKRVADRAARFQRLYDHLTGYVIPILEALPEPKKGTRRLEGQSSTLALASCPASVNVTNETAVPARFLVEIPATTRPDKDAIKKAIQAGEQVAGAELITDKQRLKVI